MFENAEAVRLLLRCDDIKASLKNNQGLTPLELAEGLPQTRILAKDIVPQLKSHQPKSGKPLAEISPGVLGTIDEHRPKITEVNPAGSPIIRRNL